MNEKYEVVIRITLVCRGMDRNPLTTSWLLPITLVQISDMKTRISNISIRIKTLVDIYQHHQLSITLVRQQT